jgi:hypothetical protein
MVTKTLPDLESELKELSHCEDAITAVRNFVEHLGSTKKKLAAWNAENAIVRRPIEPEEVRGFGFDTEDDRFTMLQGDIVATDAAFFLGERITESPKYAILNSSCDLVTGRSSCNCLLRIREVRQSDPDWKSTIGLLLTFKRRDSMYIPPLPHDASDVMGNVIEFDGFCQIRAEDLQMATRIASLSLVGWRIFGSFSRIVIARANPREVDIRSAVDSADSIRARMTA